MLANEQVINGHCERCDTPVIQKELDQCFKITDYADRLISGLRDIDWPEDVKVLTAKLDREASGRADHRVQN